MSSKHIINAVEKLVMSLPDRERLRILDISCGDGKLLEALARRGCRVEGTHFREDDYIYSNPSSVLRDATIHENIDISKPLPFDDSEYDVVLATEVFEHLPSHVLPCSEIARILKDGGYFIFSTPNIHRLTSRMRFMFTGRHEMRSARLGWNVPPGELYSTHYNPVYFPVFHTLLYHNGLRVERLGFSTFKPWAGLLAILYPVVGLATAVETRHAIKRSGAGGRDLLRWMLDPRMLFSDNLIVIAGKTDPLLKEPT